jgi:hypothetical protein
MRPFQRLAINKNQRAIKPASVTARSISTHRFDKACTGSSLAAFLAGNTPNNIPVVNETANAAKIAQAGIDKENVG